MPEVRANFDANVPVGDPIGRKDDYKILISTEVLAEGVNLHRAHVVVNYDTPWNSTRLMQRIGRVNRIGTTAKKIYIYNFYPTAQVNSQIELENKAKLKLFAFHSALGEDSGIYSPDESPETFGLFDHAIEEERDERLQFFRSFAISKIRIPMSFAASKTFRCGRAVDVPKRKKLLMVRSFSFETSVAMLFTRSHKNNWPKLDSSRWRGCFAPKSRKSLRPFMRNITTMCAERVADFREKLEVDAARELAVDHTLGPNEQKAIRLLAPPRMPNVSAAEKALLTAAQHAIKLAKFQDLPRKLNKLQKDASAKSGKRIVSTAAYLDKLMEIVRAYPLEVEDTDEQDA